MTDVLVLDMAGLRFRATEQRSALKVLAASGELLAVIDTLPATQSHHAAFAAMDAALATAQVRRDGKNCKIALYNPLTAQVVYRPVPSLVFSDEEPLVVPPGGVLARLEDDVLVIGERVLERVDPSFASATRAWAASRR
jgi:hypothetical protein